MNERNVVNKKVTHKIFGAGVVTNLSGNILTVDFFNVGIKKLSYKSVINNNLLIFEDDKVIKETPKPTFDKPEENVFWELFKEIIEDKDKLFYELIIKYINNETIYQLLVDRVTNIVLDSLKKEATDFEKNIVLFFISMVAFKSYDGSLWPHVQKELNKLYTLLSPQRIEHIIRSFITNKELYIGSRHITNALVNAAIPFKFFKSYFVFVYDIFSLNFEKSIEGVPVEEVLGDTFLGLKSILSDDEGEEDELNLTVTNKTYQLIKSTKLAIINFPREMAKITSVFIEIIHNWYYNNPISSNISSFHKEALTEWEKEQKKEKLTTTKRKEYIRDPRYFYDPRYKRVYIEFPSISIRDVEDIDVNLINITINSSISQRELFHNRDFKVIDRIGYKSLIIDPQIIDDPLNKINICVKYEDGKIYNSDNKLHRDYIIFNDVGKEISSNTNYDGIVYLLHNDSFQVEGSVDLTFDNYIITTFQAVSTKIYKIGNESIYFSKMVKEDLYGDLINEIICLTNNNEINVFRKIKNYIFKSIDKQENISVYINNRKYDLNELLESHDIFNDEYRYVVNLEKLNLNNDVHEIRVVNKHGHRLKTERFIIDSDFKIEINNIEDLKYDINIDSSFNLDSYAKESFDYAKEAQAEFTFNLGIERFRYISLSFPRFKYNINDDWQRFSDLEFISNNLYVTKEVSNIVVYLSDHNKFYLELVEENRNYKVYDLSRFINYKVDYDKVDFGIEFEDKETVYYRFYLNQTIVGSPKLEFLTNGGLKVNFDIKCFEPETLILKMNDPNGLEEEYDLDEKYIILNEYTPYKNYHFLIRKKNVNVFFEKNIPLFDQFFKIFDTSRLGGKRFMVSGVGYWDNDGLEKEIEVRPTALKFIRKVNYKDIDYKSSNFRQFNYIYLCKLYKVTISGSIIPFRRKNELYAEIAVDRDYPFLTVYLEDEDGEGITIDVKNEIIEEIDLGKNDGLDYLFINTNTEEV